MFPRSPQSANPSPSPVHKHASASKDFRERTATLAGTAASSSAARGSNVGPDTESPPKPLFREEATEACDGAAVDPHALPERSASTKEKVSSPRGRYSRSGKDNPDSEESDRRSHRVSTKRCHWVGNPGLPFSKIDKPPLTHRKYDGKKGVNSASEDINNHQNLEIPRVLRDPKLRKDNLQQRLVSLRDHERNLAMAKEKSEQSRRVITEGDVELTLVEVEKEGTRRKRKPAPVIEETGLEDQMRGLSVQGGAGGRKLRRVGKSTDLLALPQ